MAFVLVIPRHLPIGARTFGFWQSCRLQEDTSEAEAVAEAVAEQATVEVRPFERRKPALRSVIIECCD